MSAGAVRIVVVSAGLSDPSSTRLLADRLLAALRAELETRGRAVDAAVIEVRDHAHAVVDQMLTGFAGAELAAAQRELAEADAVIAVTPVFSTSYSGLFKAFFDVLDRDALDGTPVLLGATAGTPRHSLALDYAIRPLFEYLHARTVSTSVFAAAEDWGSGADQVAPLGARVARAAGELADALTGAGGRERRDPFAPETYLGPGGSFEDLLGDASRRG